MANNYAEDPSIYPTYVDFLHVEGLHRFHDDHSGLVAPFLSPFDRTSSERPALDERSSGFDEADVDDFLRFDRNEHELLPHDELVL